MPRLLYSDLYRILMTIVYVEVFSAGELSSVCGVNRTDVKTVLDLLCQRKCISQRDDGWYEIDEGAGDTLLRRSVEIVAERTRLRPLRQPQRSSGVASPPSSSKFSTVVLMARRAEQLLRGARPRVETEGAKLTTVAMIEVRHGLVTHDNIEEVDDSAERHLGEEDELFFDFGDEEDTVGGPGFSGWSSISDAS